MTSRRAGLAALALALWLPLWGATASAQSGAPEYAVKATYLYKFIPFVERPETALASPSSAVNLCVVGNDPFGDLLDRAVGGQHIGERPIVVRRFPTATRDLDCQVIYVAGSPAQSVADILATVRGRPVLTVTDSIRGAGPKGIINLIVEDDRVRFEIDDAAASENGLTISSKLLSLAVRVKPRA